MHEVYIYRERECIHEVCTEHTESIDEVYIHEVYPKYTHSIYKVDLHKEV